MSFEVTVLLKIGDELQICKLSGFYDYLGQTETLTVPKYTHSFTITLI